jgi:nucleotide-binding universal stress UspA family protein
MMIKSILLAVDGSSTSRKAADYALWLAKNLGAKVVLFHAIDETLLRGLYSLAEGGPAASILDPLEKNLKEGATQYLEEFEGRFREDNVPCEAVTRAGIPAVEIVKEAEARKVDLIILGSHGRSIWGATALGSVAYGVIHHDTKIPVLIIRKEDE